MYFFFFFSSRRRHTRLTCDWSSDVCSSDLASATVRSWLEEEGDHTRVMVHTTMNVTGRPAQFGRGVMADVSGRIIEKFASNLAVQCAAGAVPAAAGAGGGSAEASGGSAAASGDG